MLRSLIRGLLLLTPLLSLAGNAWHLSFPEISTDSNRVYFSGAKWTAIYTAGRGADPVTIVRDSLAAHALLPAPAPLPETVEWNDLTFRAEGHVLIMTGAPIADSVRALPPPTSEAVAGLTKAAGKTRIHPEALVERIGPITLRQDRIWFGLSLRDSLSGASVGGIGWFDPTSGRFGRMYSPALAALTPAWIGARKESIYLFLKPARNASPSLARFIELSVSEMTLSEVSLKREGIPGDELLNVIQWGDTLAIATDETIAIWEPGKSPKAWQTRAYAARATRWLYLKTFADSVGAASDSVQFLPLKSNTPTEVKAKVGSWLQVVAPIGIEGYIDADAWEQHAVLWSQKWWACRDSVCFARIRVPMENKMIATDFTNTPLTYLDRDSRGVKVGFRAAWAREEDLIPIMIAP